VAHVLSKGLKIPSGSVVLHWLPQTNSEVSQVAFTVSKKVGNSVQRHRVTRVLRHIMMTEITQLNNPKAIVVRALSNAASTPTENLKRDIQAGISKVNANV
jgi:ribonuclease P protein component